jgi:hypothetical protein
VTPILKKTLLFVFGLSLFAISAFSQVNVHVESSLVGPRALEAQTGSSVVRDYLEAWQGMSRAMQGNQPSLLDADFVGVAKEKLANAILQQRQIGVQTLYKDESHDIKLVFYSPEGLSIQLVDDVAYEVTITDSQKLAATQHVRARYVAVLSPTESRWKVRILQAEAQ